MAGNKRIEIMRRIPFNSRIYWFYYKKIMTSLKEMHWKRTNTLLLPYKIKFNTQAIIYNHESFELVKSMFKRIGWKLTLVHYNWTEATGAAYELNLEKMTPYERERAK